MSLINEALKKAQQGGQPIRPPGAHGNAFERPAPPPPYVPRHNPRGARLVFGGIIILAIAISGGGVVLLFKGRLTPTPNLPETTVAENRVEEVLVRIPRPAVAETIPSEAITEDEAALVAPPEATPVTPPPAEPVAETPPPPPVAEKNPAPEPAPPPPPVAEPEAATTAAPEPAAKAEPEPEPTPPPPPPPPPEPEPDPTEARHEVIRKYLREAHVAGIRYMGEDSRAILNNRVIGHGTELRINETTVITVVSITPNRILFHDESGTEFRKSP
jgi:hypothetical protein